MATAPASITLRVDSQTALLAGALGFHLAWTSLVFSSLILPQGLVALAYGISAVVFGISLFALGALKEAPRFLTSPLARTLIALCLSCSSLGIALVFQQSAPLPLPTALGCGVASGALSACFFAAIGNSYAWSAPATAKSASVFAYIASIVVFVVLRIAVPELAPLLAAALPIIALVLLNGAQPPDAPPQRDLNSMPLEPQADGPSAVEKNAALRFVVCVGMIGVVNEAVRTVNGNAVFQAIEQMAVEMEALESVLAICGMLALGFMFTRQNNEVSILRCYRAIVFLTIVTLLFPLTLVDPAAPSSVVFMALHLAIYSCLGCFTWLVATTLCATMPELGVRTLFRAFGLKAIASVVGIVLGQALAGTDLESPVLLTIAGSIVMLLAAYLLVFSEAHLDILAKASQPRGDGPFMEACRRLISEHGLSKREGEIMVMFAKGRNRAYVCEQLVISKSTVSMHRQHIYRKLDIHSQQELIDLIDRTKIELQER